MSEQGQHEERDIYDLGLQADLAMWMYKPVDRRRLLQVGAVGIGALLAGVGTASNALATTTSAADLAAACVTTIPQETAGPYPADGSQASSTALNALGISGIVRKDIRTSLGTGTVAPGIPLTIELTLVNSAGDCAPLPGYALYGWHCDRAGRYSLYSEGVTNEDYLRGVQAADANGKITFSSIFPACYQGRWPHIHFEIYPALDKATSAANAIQTSQLALPKDVCDVVYATPGYEQSVANLAQLTLETDGIFSDGYAAQLATVTGDATTGYVAALTVGVDPASTNQGAGTGPGTDGGPTGAPPQGTPPQGPPPSGAPRPSGAPQPSAAPSASTAPSASASPRPSTSAAPSGAPTPSPSVTPGLPNTGEGGMSGGAKGWTLAAAAAALAALAAPVVRRLRRR